jgi:hypothetical protein
MGGWPETTRITYLEFSGGGEAEAGINLNAIRKFGAHVLTPP